jgi:hypothetical protein
LRASFARRMLQYVPAPPANGSFSAAAGTSVTGVLAGQAIGGAAPTWASTPSLNVFGGIAGSTTFSFSGGSPTSVVIEPGDTLPAWVTSVTTTGINWGTAAAAGSSYSFRLRASNGFGASTSNVINGTVQAVSTGLWGTEYAYASPIWQQYRHNGTRLTGADGVGHDAAVYNLCCVRGKDHDVIYRGTTGRLYVHGGDVANWSMNLDGFTTGDSLSNQSLTNSFHDTINPTWITREAGRPTSQSEMYAQIDDNQSVMWDSVNDRMLYLSSSSFGNEWAEDSSNGFLGPIISPVTLVNSTTARFASTVATVPVGTKLKFRMTVGAIANVFKRGRVTSVTDIGGGQIEVVLNWWDTLTNFQSPTGVVISRSDTEFVPRHSTPTGAWQEANLGTEYYNESTGKFYAAIMAMDFTTRKFSRILFEAAARDTGQIKAGGVFLPAAATGRGPEVWAFSGGYFSQMAKYDLTAGTVTIYSTGMGDSTSNVDAVRTNKGCHDGRGNIYFTGPRASPANLIVVNVRGATPTAAYKATNYPGRMVNTDPDINFSMVSYRMVWNEEIQRIELYCIENGGTVVDGAASIFLIDPSTTPAKVERVTDVDANGRKISAAGVAHVPTVGASPAHTWLVGGAGAEPAGIEPCSRSRIFIAANRRKWEELTPGPHWYQSFTPFNPKATDDSTTYSQISQIPEPCFGHWVPETDSNGHNTGKVFIRAGGDGNYGGNEVTILRMDQITGTVYPTQLNTVTSSAGFAQWHNRIRTGFQSGSTTAASELLINPANPAEWSPVSIHTQFINTFVPGYGYVEDWISPTSLSTSGVRHTRSAYAAANPGVLSAAINDNSYPDGNWGNSYGMAQQLGGVSNSLNFWSDTGGNAGKWQRAFISGTGRGKRLACFNPTRNVLLGYIEDTSDTCRFFEWTPGAADFTSVKVFSGSSEVVNQAPGWTAPVGGWGSNASAIWWVEGDDYLIYRRTYGSAAANGFMRYNRSTKVLTALRTTTGSAILDAHFGTGKEGTAIINREARQIIWVLFSAMSSSATLTLYRSSFDDLMNLRPLYVSNGTQTFNIDNQIERVGIKNGFVFNGQLYLMSRAGINYGLNLNAAKVHRIPIY